MKKELNIAGTIQERMDIIEPLIKNRKVLDLGVVASRRSRGNTADRLEEKMPNLLFSSICEINPETLGVDIDEAGINILKAKGFNVMAADAITMNLGKQFDTIIAGEIIEHIVNPGQFLSNLRQHLTPTGTIVITTPNPFYAKQVWKIWRHNRPQVHDEHTSWFDPITLCHLCYLSGLTAHETYWIKSKKGQLLKTWPRLFRDYFSHSFMVLARPSSSYDS